MVTVLCMVIDGRNNMIFTKYPSIENSDRIKVIKYIEMLGIQNDEWVVLNKIHGSNASIYMDGFTTKIARKCGFIKDDENFNNLDDVVNGMKHNLKKAYRYLCYKYDVEDVTFYGELAGGDYPHPNTPKLPHAIRCQKGVFYAPFNFFYMFDIKVGGKFVNHDEVVYVGETFNILYAKPLFKGILKECLDYPNDFIDQLHKEFNLPSITEGDVYKGTDKIIGTITEGKVIKPNIDRLFGNGKRVILKDKNEFFSEASSKKKREPKDPHKWTVEGAELFSLLSTYITENRLRNVLSHGYDIGQKDFGKLMGIMNKDVWKDFLKYHDDRFNCLDVTEQKIIKKKLGKWTADLIRPHFCNIIDGEF